MNLTFDTNLSTQTNNTSTSNTNNTSHNINSTTTTYTPSRVAGTYDIADNKVMDNEAYKGHGLTAEDIMQQAANTNVSAQKDFMIVMSHCVSGEDFEEMAKDGFTPGDVDPEEYVTIVDRIKATLASAGVDVEGYTDTLDMETLEAITGAVTQALEIKNMSDDTVKYLVENDKAPTIENLYKAGYSTTDNIIQSKGYYSDGAYYAKKADTIDIDNLMDSLENAVTKAGFTDDEKQDAIETAKWLVESGIELNTDNLNNAYNIRSLELPLDKDDVTKLCVTAVINGKSPYEALLTGEKTIDEQAREVLEQANSITDDQIHQAVETGVELNIKNLANINTTTQDTTTQPQTGEASLKEIQARREMEEIRLAMTEEANRRLIRQGISVDTTKLSDLVDMLKNAEAQIKETLYKGGSNEVNIDRENLYNETIAKTDEIADMPASIIGPLAAKVGTYTINDIYDAGTKELSNLADYSKAGEYEKFMTTPRRDLGDSITKAFRNVDDILTDMGLETSDSNRRAVRILGYNSMEISQENIEQVKQADRELNDTINKMNPATVLKMIRDNKNPLNMSMDEINEYLDKNKDNSLENSEKYSKFLQKLDRNGDITDSEREAYIGIYRLFNQIERSDGAVIGSIIASGAQMNFKNMLSAVRTSNDKNMDVTIDDGFGALSELITGTKAIDAQINEGFDSSPQNSGDENARNQEKYYASLAGGIDRELADNTDISKLKTADITPQTTIENFSDMLQDLRTEDYEATTEFEAYKDSLNQAVHAEDEIIQELLDYSQPVTTYNIEAAMLMSTDKNKLFKDIISKDADSKASDDIIDLSDSFIEGLEDKDSGYELYNEIIKSASKALDEQVYNQSTSLIDIKSAQGMYKELSLLSGLSREENYQVPMEIDGEVTNVNLKIFHNKSKAGKVAVTIENESLGKIAAEFNVDNDKITGMVACENKEALAALNNISDTLTEAFEDKKVNLSLVESKSINLDMFGTDRDKDSTEVSTSELYKTAKVFLKSLNKIGEDS
jgi:hypothetical protein